MSIDRLAEEWVSTRAIADIDADGFSQVDVDDVFDVPPADPVHLGPAFLRAARDRAEASRSGLVAMLVVPLPSSEELILRAPDFAEVASAAWKYGPGREVVGLYLLEPRVLTVHEPAEEYRCDVDASDVVGRGPSVYFRSWRTPSDAANGWGFSQAFYVRLHG